ncbi:hypothetical protein SNEBB_011390 [Seison nebaliae]|nr:hypothetical protein SNEBB_011390 [Seison nebaliae]
MPSAKIKNEKTNVEEETCQYSKDLLTLCDIGENIRIIEKSLMSKDVRQVKKALQNWHLIRSRLNFNVLSTLLKKIFNSYNVDELAILEKFLDNIREKLTDVQMENDITMIDEEMKEEVKNEEKEEKKEENEKKKEENEKNDVKKIKYAKDWNPMIYLSSGRPSSNKNTNISTPLPFNSSLPPINMSALGTVGGGGAATLSLENTVALSKETRMYIYLLVQIFSFDHENEDQAMQICEKLLEEVCYENRRSMDSLAAKLYYYFSLMKERSTLDEYRKLRVFLLSRYKIAALHNDAESCVVLINLILRNYLRFHQFGQANKFRTKIEFNERVDNNETARYYYYIGRINAINLEYTEAHMNLMVALRKAPQYKAIGFKQNAQKLCTVIELLLGDIPDRSVFRIKEFRRCLYPYFLLVQSLRIGDLRSFSKVIHDRRKNFIQDDTMNLVIRLRHNVIKAGVNRICNSYSRIKLSDMARKLQLDSIEDTEYVTSKAIRDGVIANACIDHEDAQFVSLTNTNIYQSTLEPMDSFARRIDYCMKLHQLSVQAMKYSNAAKKLRRAREEEERRRKEEERDARERRRKKNTSSKDDKKKDSGLDDIESTIERVLNGDDDDDDDFDSDDDDDDDDLPF